MTTIANRYVLDEIIGAGAMGDVFLARDTQTQQQVAVKTLKQAVIQDTPEVIERFVQEGRVLRQLNHPNIVKMLDYVEEGDTHYLVMEYVRGGNLRDLIKAEGHIPLSTLVAIALELADALTRAHHLGVIHRDLKPANVMLADDGTPRLTDFGLAFYHKEGIDEEEGSLVGTMPYLSPEACMGHPPNASGDIWAFGILLFEMLTGSRPFDGPGPGQILVAIMRESLPDPKAARPDAPDPLVDLIYRMLDKNPDARIPSVRLIGAELEAIGKGVKVQTAHIKPVQVVPSTTFDTPTQPTHIRLRNLPAQLTPFVGRREEIADITTQLDTCRLVTLLGPGGIGKTRLSIEVARQQVTNFPQGVHFVPLAPLDTAANIPMAIADTLDIKISGMDDLVDYLREKTLMLVLDNFEHLADGADLVNTLLTEAPSVALIATSRTRLNVRGECVYQVEPLPVPQDETDTSGDAVQMFVTYARRQQPDYEVEDAPAVNRICRLVGGLPLGIMLAASWVTMLELDEIVEEIEQDIDFLETDMTGIPDRHQGLRAAFEYSWNLLSEKERESLARLSIFRGGTTRKAAQSVTGTSLRTLKGLVDKSLVTRDPTSGRFYIHTMIRQFAAEHLTDAQALHEAHSRYYLEEIAARRSAITSAAQINTLEEIETDFENVRAGWMHAVEQAAADLLEAAADTVYFFCLIRGRFEEKTTLFEAAAKAVPASGRLLMYQASTLGYLPPDENTEATIKQARELADAPDVTAFCDLALGFLAFQERDFEAAVAYFEQADEEAADRFLQTMINHLRAMPLTGLGRGPEALETTRHAYQTATANGNVYHIAAAGNNLGVFTFGTGELDATEGYLKEAVDARRALKDQKFVAWSLAILGAARYFNGKFVEGIATAQQAADEALDVGHPETRGITDSILAMLLCMDGQTERGRQLALQSEQFIGSSLDAAAGMHTALAYAEVAAGNYDAAHQQLQQALPNWWRQRSYVRVLVGLPTWGAVLAHQGDLEAAAALLACITSHDVAPPGLPDFKLVVALREQLQEALTAERYQAARARGAAQDVSTFVEAILARNET